MRLDLNLMAVMVAMVEEGSGSAAARRLRMSQPAVSAALSRLRHAFGDQLFVRTSRGMEPTPRALSLVTPMRSALAMIENEVLRDMAFDPLTCERTVTFAMSDVGEMVFLPRILERVQQLAPRMSVRCVTTAPAQTERAMELGEIDLAVGYFPDLKGNNYYQQRLFSHGFTCLLRKAHPIRARRLTKEQFMELGHAVVRADGRSQEVFERFLTRQGIQRRVVLNTPHFMSIPLIIGKSDLVATVPLAVGTSFAATGTVRLVKPPFEIPRFDLRQHWHRRFNHDPQSRWLRGVVHSLFNDEMDEWKGMD